MKDLKLLDGCDLVASFAQQFHQSVLAEQMIAAHRNEGVALVEQGARAVAHGEIALVEKIGFGALGGGDFIGVKLS